MLNKQQIDEIFGWIENSCALNFNQIRCKILQTLNLRVSLLIAANFLEGRVFIIKQVHSEAVTVNSE